ncbi:MAG: tRNA-(ms[2]io[6]A)-hydroxylase [Cyanobacteria bacterium SID2]|nr:tRNA-(ms[2]io[6]A)-hydroxylase [Cyanobacteria bacterium SID2]MBP0003969.1 tRNA-(ms[2]io[6]A)-hydroxylase [Cyanobacteria bacterium SBC]
MRLPTIKFLQEPTSEAWVEQAIENLDIVLLDCSHCERKAAGVALNMMCRYPSDTQLVRELTAIAKEELEHFEQVNRILEERGIPLAPLAPPPYGAKLKAQVRREEPGRKLDLLLVAASIEARSHERLGLLASRLEDNAENQTGDTRNRELAAFYRGLMASEARHYGIYWVLATTNFDRETVDRRLQELATVESQILATLHPQPRVHS